MGELLAGPDSRVYDVQTVTEWEGWARIAHPACRSHITFRNGRPDLPAYIAALMEEHVCHGPGWRGGRAIIVAGDQSIVVVCHGCSNTWLPDDYETANKIRHEHRCHNGQPGQFTMAGLAPA